MTGDSRLPAPAGSWGHRIGPFEHYYAGWKIGSTGFHYTAQRKVGGRGQGPRLKARTLDALAALIEATP